MYCSHCGEELREGVRFCENCGSPVPEKDGQDRAPSGKKKALIAGIVAAVLLAAGIGVMVGQKTGDDSAGTDGEAQTQAQTEASVNAAADTPKDYYDPDEYDFTAVTVGGLSQYEMDNVLDVVTAYTDAKDKKKIGQMELNAAAEESSVVIARILDPIRTEDRDNRSYAVFPMDEVNRLLSFFTMFQYEPDSTYLNGTAFTEGNELWIAQGIGWEQSSRTTSVGSSEEEIGLDYHTVESYGPDAAHTTYYHATLRPNDQGRFYLYSIEYVDEE